MRRQTPELLVGETREAYLRRAIDNEGLTLKDFAAKAGIPVTSLGTILKRGVGSTSLDTAIKICDALEIDLEILARSEYYSGSTDTDIAIIEASERLRKTRYALRYRAAALAEMLDISLAQYQRFECAHYVIPLKYIRLLASIMGVSYNYLARKSDEAPELVGLCTVESPEEYEEYDLGRAIQSLRVERGLSQKDLAERMNKPCSLIQQWEMRIRVPLWEDLADLCAVFSATGAEVDIRVFQAFPAGTDSLALSKKENALIEKYREAGDKERRMVDLVLDIEGDSADFME